VSAWWGAIIAVFGMVAGGALANVLNEEIRARLDLLPRALIRMASRRLPRRARDELGEEWLAELDAIVNRAAALPITRLLTGIRYASSLLLRGAPAVARELSEDRQGHLLRVRRVHVATGLLFGVFVASLWHVDGGLPAVVALLPLFIVPLFAVRWALAQARIQEEVCGAAMAALCQAMEAKDHYTFGHSRRVAKGSVMLARELGLPAERIKAVRYAGLLHDIGKLAVPTTLLQKTAALTEEEFVTIKLHAQYGLEIVRDIGFLDEVLAGIVHHHEKMDGRGYPMGLAGDEIPEFARIIAVADTFDCMTADRSYRSRKSCHDAIAELRNSAGEHFDPMMVAAFVRAMERDGWQAWPPDDPGGLVEAIP
jgi:putative nucleotidyltransferase with HDIG domain